MRLLKFRVKDFRSVTDSGWIDAEQVTALIGVNESGKTNLLLPLWKLNPAREGEIKPTSDFPKGNYAAVREKPANFWFIHAHFTTDALAVELAKLTGLDSSLLDVVYVAKNFAGSVWIGFPKFEKPTVIPAWELQGQLELARSEIALMAQLAKEGTLKEAMLAAIETAKAAAHDDQKNNTANVATIHF